MSDPMNLLILFALPVFIITIFTPYLTRRTESFGISIPSEVYSSSKLKTMRRHYALINSLFSILFLILFIIFGSNINDENTLSLLFSIFIVGFMIIGFLTYLRFHFKTKHLKSKYQWTEKKSQHVAINTNFHQQKLKFSNGWFGLSFILAIITIILTLYFYERIPDPLPLQYNFSGEVTSWTTKTYRSVLLLPSAHVFLLIIFMFVNTIIEKSKQQVSVENSEASNRQNIIFRRSWSLFLIIASLLIGGLFSLIQLSYIYDVSINFVLAVSIIITFVILLGAIMLSIKVGQGGSRIPTSTSRDDTVVDRDDDPYWKLGLFYYNKDDPTLFLEKRFGVGWSINWARPAAWLSLGTIILLAFIIPIVFI